MMAEENDQVPEVMVEMLKDINTVAEQNIHDANEGQLKRPPSVIPRNRSPVTIQEWVDSLPTAVDQKEDFDNVESSTIINSLDADNLTLGAEAGLLSKGRPIPNVTVTTESNIVHAPSESGSQTSSFDSKLLNARKPDPEEILLGLGFGGGIESTAYSEYGRVPKRFLQPSQLKGVSVEEYIQHQQELIHMYESGLWGYRGLTGPPHASPSVIVAKIMEKLREHERDMTCPKGSSRTIVSGIKHMQSIHKNAKQSSNRFNKAAENILTKIRCTPGSVLTPDNRKWLDSQGGDKSPELSRRLMIGQQSFVLTRDGTLIETPPCSVINENLAITTDENVINGQVSTTNSNRSSQLDEEAKVLFKVSSSSSVNTDTQIRKASCSSFDIHRNDYKMEDLKPVFDLNQSYDKDYSPERDLEDLLSIVEPCQDASKASSDVDSGAASDSADTSFAQINLMSLTENELTATEDIYSKNLCRQYEDLCNLRLRLNVLGCPFNIVPQDQFMSLSAEQRCALQCKILRLALRVYLNKLSDDEIHHELQSCLGAEVQHVADLLDSNSDVDKLAIIVRQMTVLLHHQTHLNSQLAELTVRAQNPTACHDMCELILQRVRGLEQLVEQNANELALMKAQLLNKKT